MKREGFFHLAKFWILLLLLLLLFCFWENVLFNSHVLCHANCSWRKTFKQPLIDVLKNFAIFIGKKLCWSLYFIKFQDWRPAFLFKMRLRQQTMLVFFCEYSEVFKNSFLIGDVFIIPIGNLYLGIDHWCFRVIFYYCKIRPRNRKNFATDQSKSFISLFKRLVSSLNCKEKLVALNWATLVSNFSKYI